MPSIDDFDSDGISYLDWRDPTENALGTAGCTKYLDDPAATEENPEEASMALFQLREALRKSNKSPTMGSSIACRKRVK